MGSRADMMARLRSTFIGTTIGSSFVSGSFSIWYATPFTDYVGATAALAVTESGGAAPVTYAVQSGALPDGLSLDTNTGEITGTYTAEGSFSATIRATDADLETADASISWTVITSGEFFSPYGYGLQFPEGY